MCNEVGANDIINMVWDINVLGLQTKHYLGEKFGRNGKARQFKINGKRLEFLSSYSFLLVDSLARFPVIYYNGSTHLIP